MAKFFLISVFIMGSGVPDYYETYREQLFRHFLIQGRGTAAGVPAARLRLTVTCDHAWYMAQQCPENTVQSGEPGVLDWEDGTVHLAFSLATFATEYAVLPKNSERRTASLERIGDGLAALDRLDSGSFIKFGMNPSLDGLFLRDDAGSEQLVSVEGANCLRGGNACYPGANRRNLSSQDQYVYLSLGLATVLHTVPDSAIDPVSGRNLNEWAASIGRRMGSRWVEADWRIRTPTGEPVHLGQWIHFSSWPLYRWYRRELNGRQFHGFPGSAGRMLWQFQFFWPFDPANPLSNEVNLGMALALSALNGKGLGAVREKAIASNMVVFYIWGCWLHDKNPHPSAMEMLEGILAGAPEGGAGYFPAQPGVPGWRSENRWFHPERYHGMEWEADCLFNGLDYMLARNLFLLFQQRGT